MEFNDMTSVQEIFQQMPTEKLRELLDKELHSEPVNDNAIRLILSILRERERNTAVVMTPELEKAWEKYQRDSSKIWEGSERSRKIRRWIVRVASSAAMLVVLLLAVVPQQVGADSLWDKIASWTENIFGFSKPNAVEQPQEEYRFQTNIDGLQQIYDAVVELGVTTPVVPSWLPGEPKLVECKMLHSRAKDTIKSTFVNMDTEIVFNVNVYNSSIDFEYHKDDTPVTSYEREGITYNIMRNQKIWVVVWGIDNIECSVFIDCQEDTLYQILESIYEMEDN